MMSFVSPRAVRASVALILFACLALAIAPSIAPAAPGLPAADDAPHADTLGIAGIMDPTVSPDGKTIAFSYRGDLWTVPVEGGVAKQLTNTPAHESAPAYAPSGQVLAFVSDENGNKDVFITFAWNAGRRMQVTFNSANDDRPTFTPDGSEILFQSQRDSDLDLALNTSLWDLWRVPAAGGTPSRLTFFRGHNPSVAPDGSIVAFDRYESGYAEGEHSVCMMPLKGGVPRIGASGRQNQRNPLVLRNRIFFVMNAHGVHHVNSTDNIWKMPHVGGAQIQCTAFSSPGVGGGIGSLAAPAGVANPAFLVFEREFRLHRLDIETNAVTPIVVTLPDQTTTEAENDPVTITLRSRPSAVDNGPGAFVGGEVAFELDGDIWSASIDPTTENPAAVRPKPLLQRSESLSWPARSPDGQWIACVVGGSGPYGGGDATITLYPIGLDSESRRAIEVAGKGSYRNPEFTPDGKTLLYATFEEDDSIRETAIAAFDMATHTTITLIDEPELFELYPQVAPDGRTLYVVGTRSGQGGFSSALYRADLTTRNSDGGIATALVELPSRAHRGPIRHLTLSPDGRTLAYIAAGPSSGFRGGSQRVYAYDVETEATAELTTQGSHSYAAWLDATTMIAVRDGDRPAMTRIALTAGDEPRTTTLPVNATVETTRAAFASQRFSAVHGAFASQFYDVHTHGIDWEARGEFYGDLARGAATIGEFYTYLDRMIAEMVSSHVHVELPAPADDVARYTGSPAWDVLHDGDALRVRLVAPNGPASRAGLVAGDRVIAIDGAPVTKRTNADKLWTRLGNPPGQGLGDLLDNGGRVEVTPWDETFKTTLRVRRADRSEIDVEVGLIWRDQLRELKYQNMVRARRHSVRTTSGGKLAYHHVRTMLGADMQDFAEFLATPDAKAAEGLVLDIRDGVGGNIHHQMGALLDGDSPDRMDGRPHAYSRGRDGGIQPDGGGNVLGALQRMFGMGGINVEAWNKPVILITNHICRSDKEIFPHLFRYQGLGTIVGEGTARGVIGSSYIQLADGGQLMMSYNVYFTSEGENMEGSGVEPDIRVPETMVDLFAARDRQLSTAIATLLAQMNGDLPFPEKRTQQSEERDHAPVIPQMPRGAGEEH